MSKGEVIERVIAQGDLAKLTSDERVAYYSQVCESVGLNPLTRPFEFITLNGRMVLYARKDCTDQLRRQHGVSIEKPDIRFEDDWIVVTVAARDATGRTDSDIGVVSRKDMRGDFGNALMKAVTKAKRRVTLSICGLGFLDESEIETIPDARPVVEQPQRSALPPPSGTQRKPVLPGGMTQEEHDALLEAYRSVGGDPSKLCDHYGVGSTEEILRSDMPAILAQIQKRKESNGAKTASLTGK